MISRQKEMGTLISDELDLQVDMIHRLEEGVDATRGRVSTARRRLNQLSKKASDKSMWWWWWWWW